MNINESKYAAYSRSIISQSEDDPFETVVVQNEMQALLPEKDSDNDKDKNKDHDEQDVRRKRRIWIFFVLVAIILLIVVIFLVSITSILLINSNSTVQNYQQIEDVAKGSAIAGIVIGVVGLVALGGFSYLELHRAEKKKKDD